MPITLHANGKIEGINNSNFNASLPTGHVIQTQQTYRTSLFSESLTTGNFSSAVMTCAITPISTSSKILVLCTVQISTGSQTNGAQALLKRDGTEIGIADAAGSRARGTGGGMGSAAVNRMQSNVQMTFLDSPSSDAALSYTAHIKPGFSGTQTVYLNREGSGGHDTDASNVGVSASSLTLMEIAA